jgi:hypothetical protein
MYKFLIFGHLFEQADLLRRGSDQIIIDRFNAIRHSLKCPIATVANFCHDVWLEIRKQLADSRLEMRTFLFPRIPYPDSQWLVEIGG